MDDKFDKFIHEIKTVQDKYKMYIEPEWEEDWDEDIDGNIINIGCRTFLMVYDYENDKLFVVPESELSYCGYNSTNQQQNLYRWF